MAQSVPPPVVTRGIEASLNAGFLLLTALAVFVARESHPASILALGLSVVVMGAVHEFAHAIVGRLVGMRVFWVTLGRGARLAQFQVGETRVMVRRTPLGGHTAAAYDGEHPRRWREVAMVAAGPMSHVAAIPCAISLVGWPFAPDFPDSYGGLEMFLLVNAWFLLANVIPRDLPLAAGGMPNDGARLLHLLRGGVTTGPKDYAIVEAVDFLERLEPERALAAARRAVTEAPRDPASRLTFALCLDATGAAAEARAVGGALLVDAPPPNLIPAIQNLVAWESVILDDRRRLQEADQFTAAATSARPDVSGFAGTRGAVLALLGRPAEALPLLERAIREGEGPARGDHGVFAALCELQRGRRTEAEQRLRAAVRLGAKSSLVARAKRALDAPGAAAGGSVA